MTRPATMALVGVVAGVLTSVGFVTAARGLGHQGGPLEARSLKIVYQPDEVITKAVEIDRLAPRTVLTVSASGFDPDTTGSVEQCVQASRRHCRNQLPVRFDGEGNARFQYLVTDEVAPVVDPSERCRLGGSRCTIEIVSADKIAVVESVFVDALPPPGRLAVSPSRGLHLGDVVAVRADDLPPGAAITVTICADPAVASRCGAPGPQRQVSVGPEGTVEADLRLDTRVVGAERVACGRQVTCRLVLTSRQIGVRAPPLVLAFDQVSGARYAVGRVIIGLALALALVIAAVWLLRSTSWAPPREADASAIDDAEYADLDLEADLADEPDRGPLG